MAIVVVDAAKVPTMILRICTKENIFCGLEEEEEGWCLLLYW
jgi:hypothetical protein